MGRLCARLLGTCASAARGGRCRHAGHTGAQSTAGFANGSSWGWSTACWRMAPADAGGAWPSLREAILDGAFTAARCQEWSNRHGMRHRVVERDPAQTGFVVLAGRWVVERSFGWLAHWGGLLRDRAGRLDVSAARIAIAASLSGVEALLNPMPVQHAAS